MQSLKELYRIGKGPSSSHTMGPERAARDFLQAYPQSARYCAVLYGSLARTGRGHLTDEAIRSVFGDRQLEIQFDLQTETPEHPNTLEFIAYDGNGDETARTVYLSVGAVPFVNAEKGNCKKSAFIPFADSAICAHIVRKMGFRSKRRFILSKGKKSKNICAACGVR